MSFYSRFSVVSLVQLLPTKILYVSKSLRCPKNFLSTEMFITVESFWKQIRKEAVVVEFALLSPNMPGKTNKKTESLRLNSRYPDREQKARPYKYEARGLKGNHSRMIFIE
jgi:hypothetical protein